MLKGLHPILTILIVTLIHGSLLKGMQPVTFTEEINEYQKSLNLQQFDAVKAGIQEVNNGNYWKAISLMNPVFELTSSPALKVLAAKQLGIAYTHVYEPSIAYYFFNFARNQTLNPEIKKFAEAQIANPQSYEFLRRAAAAKRLKMMAVERLSEFKQTPPDEYKNHSLDPDCHIQ